MPPLAATLAVPIFRQSIGCTTFAVAVIITGAAGLIVTVFRVLAAQGAALVTVTL